MPNDWQLGNTRLGPERAWLQLAPQCDAAQLRSQQPLVPVAGASGRAPECAQLRTASAVRGNAPNLPVCARILGGRPERLPGHSEFELVSGWPWRTPPWGVPSPLAARSEPS